MPHFFPHGEFAHAVAAADELVVQPRMGFSDPTTMREGLDRVRAFNGPRVGTMTIDSFTRRGMLREAKSAMATAHSLNGWPICTHPLATSRRLLEGIREDGLPVQVRHGSPLPQHIFRRAADLGIDAIEGGPVSYCLPYGRVSLAATFAAWDEAVRLWAAHAYRSRQLAHIESFGGCMLGQLSPPSLLLTLVLLEGRFFSDRHIPSLSLSLTQGTNIDQDVGALIALRRLAAEWFPNVDWHIVFYTYMGLFPETVAGAKRLIEDSAHIAVMGGANRLIVKTAAEAHHIPSIDENLTAMAWSRDAGRRARGLLPSSDALHFANLIEADARQLLGSVLRLGRNLSQATMAAFATGCLDVPHCIHPDNRDQARSTIDPVTGVIDFSSPANLSLSRRPFARRSNRRPSEQLMDALTFVRRRYDAVAASSPREATARPSSTSIKGHGT
jgi:methylaspartate mutase epsilon subunit